MKAIVPSKRVAITLLIGASVFLIGVGVTLGRTEPSGPKVFLTDAEWKCVHADVTALLDHPLERAALFVGGVSIVDRTRMDFTVRARTAFRIPFAAARLTGCHGAATRIATADADFGRYERAVLAFTTMRFAVIDKLGAMPSGGYRPDHFLAAYPGLRKSDFDGLGVEGGTYRFTAGRLSFEPWPDSYPGFRSVADAPGTIGKFDAADLLDRIAARTGIAWDSADGVERLLEAISRRDS